MPFTIAVTGGTGFVGRHLLAVATAAGHRVRALTRQPQAAMSNVTWIEGALDNGAALEQLVTDADAVIHVAGVTNARDRAGFHAGNVAGTAAICAAAHNLPFVHVSSLASREPELSVYGSTKREAEDVVRSGNGPLAIVRPPAVYGPGDTELLAVFRAARVGYVPVPAGARAAMIFGPDLAEALLSLAIDLCGQAKSNGGLFEIDDGNSGYSQADLVRAVGQSLNLKVRPVPISGAVLSLGAAIDTGWSRLGGRLPKLSFDRARYLAHPDWTVDSRPLLALGLWQPRTSLADGLAQTARWYRAHGWVRV